MQRYACFPSALVLSSMQYNIFYPETSVIWTFWFDYLFLFPIKDNSNQSKITVIKHISAF